MTNEQEIDYDVVRRYWNEAGFRSAFSASYMAHEQGLPDDCVRYRFEHEAAVVDSWFSELPSNASVLDVGCGAGTWLHHFARRYATVEGIEQSEHMVEAARKSLESFPNVVIHQANVLTFDFQRKFDGIFLGGLLMYLNREDVISLLKRLAGLLEPGGRIILRESSVRRGTETKQGDYQVIYRSPAEMTQVVSEADLDLLETTRNTGYLGMEVAVNLVDILRTVPVIRSRDVNSVGKTVWRALSLTEPVSLQLMPRILDRLGIGWPHLRNHFYLGQPRG